MHKFTLLFLLEGRHQVEEEAFSQISQRCKTVLIQSVISVLQTHAPRVTVDFVHRLVFQI